MSLRLDMITDKMIAFAEKELGVDEKTLKSVEGNEEKRQEILDKLLWIELEEIENSPEDKYSDRGMIASELLTLLCYPMPRIEEDDEVDEE